MTRAAGLLVVLAACDGGEVRVPSGPPDVTPFAACVAPEGGWADPSAPYDVDPEQGRGTVVEVGTGEPPNGCRVVGDDAVGAGEVDVAETRWLRVSVAAGELPAETWTVGFVLAGATFDVSVDDEVYVDARWTPAGFVPATGHVHLRDFEEVTKVWVGEGLTLDALTPPPGVTLAAGDELGSDSDTCGTWSWHDLTLTAGETTGTVPAGTRARVGPWLAHDGGLVVVDEEGGCLDWFPGHAAVALERVGPLAP